VHRDQDGLVCFSEHCDVPEMNITDVATPASLRFEMNQWTLRVRCVAWSHHYILKCNIPHSTALLAACGHRTVLFRSILPERLSVKCKQPLDITRSAF
jgi:hypothetical protein